MEIILLEQVEKLGVIGKITNVKNGYAKNYLIPQGKALPATKQNKALFEAQRAEIEKKSKVKQEAAEETAKALEGKFFPIIRQAGDDGRLHGAVNPRDIVKKIEEDTGLAVEKTSVSLDKAIKELGVHPLKIKLYARVSPLVYVVVARSAEEAKEAQKQFVEVPKEGAAAEEQNEPAAAANSASEEEVA